ncbi:MAG: hypothetical protein NZ534_07680, partial [Bacteroidia bacterium]|nr:hypothetical protein [Bacteroidia bacterium]
MAQKYGFATRDNRRRNRSNVVLSRHHPTALLPELQAQTLKTSFFRIAKFLFSQSGKPDDRVVRRFSTA